MVLSRLKRALVEIDGLEPSDFNSRGVTNSFIEPAVGILLSIIETRCRDETPIGLLKSRLLLLGAISSVAFGPLPRRLPLGVLDSDCTVRMAIVDLDVDLRWASDEVVDRDISALPAPGTTLIMVDPAGGCAVPCQASLETQTSAISGC